MATPDFDRRPNEAEWTILPQYLPDDNEGRMVCALTGFSKRPDEVVYRGPHIDDFYGFFAIGQHAAENLASLIGWVDPDTIDSTVQQAADNMERIEELERIIAEKDEIIGAYEVLLGPYEPEPADARLGDPEE